MRGDFSNGMQRPTTQPYWGFGGPGGIGAYGGGQMGPMSGLFGGYGGMGRMPQGDPYGGQMQRLMSAMTARPEQMPYRPPQNFDMAPLKMMNQTQGAQVLPQNTMNQGY